MVPCDMIMMVMLVMMLWHININNPYTVLSDWQLKNGNSATEIESSDRSVTLFSVRSRGSVPVCT